MASCYVSCLFRRARRGRTLAGAAGRHVPRGPGHVERQPREGGRVRVGNGMGEEDMESAG